MNIESERCEWMCLDLNSSLPDPPSWLSALLPFTDSLCCVVDVCTNCGFIKIGLRLGHGVVGRERWAVLLSFLINRINVN